MFPKWCILNSTSSKKFPINHKSEDSIYLQIDCKILTDLQIQFFEMHSCGVLLHTRRRWRCKETLMNFDSDFLIRPSLYLRCARRLEIYAGLKAVSWCFVYSKAGRAVESRWFIYCENVSVHNTESRPDLMC